MNRTIFASLAVCATAFSLTSCASDEKKPVAESKPAPAPAPLSYHDSATVVITGRVERMDQGRRWITLRDPSGHSTTYVVSSKVQRFNEVRVGDTVTATYTAALNAELRPPTAEEAANPILITAATSRSPQGTDPTGSERERVRIVTTVEAVDLGRMAVTLKGPMGDTTTVRARNPDNIRKLHVGDTIVIDYTETEMISLDKQ